MIFHTETINFIDGPFFLGVLGGFAALREYDLAKLAPGNDPGTAKMQRNE